MTVRIIKEGAVEAVHIAKARKEIDVLANAMSFQGLKQGRRTVNIPGAVVDIKTVFGQTTAVVVAEEKSVKEEIIQQIIVKEKVKFARGSELAFRIQEGSSAVYHTVYCRVSGGRVYWADEEDLCSLPDLPWDNGAYYPGQQIAFNYRNSVPMMLSICIAGFVLTYKQPDGQIHNDYILAGNNPTSVAQFKLIGNEIAFGAVFSSGGKLYFLRFTDNGFLDSCDCYGYPYQYVNIEPWQGHGQSLADGCVSCVCPSDWEGSQPDATYSESCDPEYHPEGMQSHFNWDVTCQKGSVIIPFYVKFLGGECTYYGQSRATHQHNDRYSYYGAGEPYSVPCSTGGSNSITRYDVHEYNIIQAGNAVIKRSDRYKKLLTIGWAACLCRSGYIEGMELSGIYLSIMGLPLYTLTIPRTSWVSSVPSSVCTHVGCDGDAVSNSSRYINYVEEPRVKTLLVNAVDGRKDYLKIAQSEELPKIYEYNGIDISEQVQAKIDSYTNGIEVGVSFCLPKSFSFN